MSSRTKLVLAPTALLFYLIIGIEILYMISPFALYYYSSYGPSLNFLHRWEGTAWLTSFFLPHFTVTSSVLLNSYQVAGWVMVLGGFALFLAGAGQIYYAKFRRRGAVTGGLYRFVRHPQYVAFAIMGFGLLLAWPRFTVLIMYVTMLFVYYFLAKREELECEEKFGETYRSYQNQTARFIPGRSRVAVRFPWLGRSRMGRAALILMTYMFALVAAISGAFVLRDLALARTAVLYSDHSATISVDFMDTRKLQQILQVALDDGRVQEEVRGVANGRQATMLNYIVPHNWYLPDVPLENMPGGVHGHVQPKAYDKSLFKVLFCRARTPGDVVLNGTQIIKKAHGRTPLLMAKVDLEKNAVVELVTPPHHVRWGDIPTPLF